MPITENVRTFMLEHAEDDLSRLLLSAARYPGIDVPFAVEQMAIRRHIHDKLPTWYANDALVFPSKLAAEQCSSEQTARYKQQLMKDARHVCDLTGGLGIDAHSFSSVAEQVTYIERSKTCYDAAMYNFSVLEVQNITGYNDDAERLAPTFSDVDVYYIDPSRRNENHARVVALSDCRPDLLVLMPVLLDKAPQVIAKLSPMLDVSHTLAALPETTEVHVVSVRNECKELLFVTTRNRTETVPVIHCVCFTADGREQHFRFTLPEERACTPTFSNDMQTYLYEPDASILKAGAYKQIAVRLGVNKLHVSSHLYTSDRLVTDFPGRIFRVDDWFPFNGRLCRTIARTIPQANIAVRNFPLSVSELRQRTGIADGGDIYLFATTMAEGRKVIVRCKKCELQ
ncbi:MAG: SAM-dependent methyltransferase [Tannerella sp.]|nr:SAM-dependent methyltransferase [Tannerella sp.]